MTEPVKPLPEIEIPPRAMQDATVLLEDGLDGFRITGEHFTRLAPKYLWANLPWEQKGREVRLDLALALLYRDHMLQPVTVRDAKSLRYVYVRHLDGERNTKLYSGLLEPLCAADVEAIVGMVDGGIHGTSDLLAESQKTLKQWRKNGLRSAVKRKRLLEIVELYGQMYRKVPSDLRTFRGAGLKAHRHAHAELKHLCERYVQWHTENPPKPVVRVLPPQPPEPAPEPEVAAPEPPAAPEPKPPTSVEPPVGLCAVCRAPGIEDGSALCMKCLRGLAEKHGITNSQLGQVPVFASPEDGWQSPLHEQMGKTGFDEGLDGPSYTALAKAFFDIEGILGQHDLSLADIGVTVDGFNDTSPRIRARQKDRRTRDTTVLAAGMEFRPNDLRLHASQVRQAVTEGQTLLDSIIYEVREGGGLSVSAQKALWDLEDRLSSARANAGLIQRELVTRDTDEGGE